MPDDDDDQRAATPASRHRGRTVTAAVLGVLAVLLLTVGAVAVWAKATVLRSEEVATLVGDAIAESDVQTALAALLADQVQDAVGLEGRLVDLLPAQLDRFAPTIAAGTNAAVERVLGRALWPSRLSRTPSRRWSSGPTRRALALLRGDGLRGGLSVDGGAVTLNLLPLVGRGLSPSRTSGSSTTSTVPELAPGGDPVEQTAQLEAALGRDLPDGFAQLVVYDSHTVADAQEAVQTAQRILALAERAVWLLVVLSIVLVAATVVVAPRRARAVLIFSLGTAATMVVLRTAVRRVVTGAEPLAPRPGGKAAIRAIVGGAGESLLRLAACCCSSRSSRRRSSSCPAALAGRPRDHGGRPARRDHPRHRRPLDLGSRARPGDRGCGPVRREVGPEGSVTASPSTITRRRVMSARLRPPEGDGPARARHAGVQRGRPFR